MNIVTSDSMIKKIGERTSKLQFQEYLYLKVALGVIVAYHDYSRNTGFDRFLEMSSKYSGVSFFAYLRQLKRQIAVRQFQRIKDLFRHFFFKSKVL